MEEVDIAARCALPIPVGSSTGCSAITTSTGGLGNDLTTLVDVRKPAVVSVLTIAFFLEFEALSHFYPESSVWVKKTAKQTQTEAFTDGRRGLEERGKEEGLRVRRCGRKEDSGIHSAKAPSLMSEQFFA